MAINILSILAISAKVERVFSGARRTILWERLRLGARVVEQSKCLKGWLRQIVKSGGFATVDVAVEVINLKGSIDKTISCNTGRSTVSK
jgi:hAT family C-terminal dimerisation region